MTPRELLEACDAIDDDCDCSGGVFAELTEYVRATVRLDDDEPPTPEWCEAVGVPNGLSSSGRFSADVYLWCEKDADATLWVHGEFVKTNPTRRDVRDLFRIVDAKLKEAGHATQR